ncbi:MAG: DUF4382 domain-containing protein [Thermodesulfobacteriota bacterium]|jgi:hypothetical protein
MRRIEKSAWMRWLLAGAVLALWTLAGCGGAGDTADGGASPSGRVAVVLTDGPADDFDQINVTITRIELFASAGEKVAVFQGPPREFNLLALAGESELFALAEVPAGTYEKIRLTVSTLELVRLRDDGTVAESHSPSLPGNGKIDLNPRGAFHVGTGETVVVQLDLDARKSIHVVQAGNKDKYVFRPVVFVDVLRREFPGKLTRIKGEVQEVSPDGSFLLCPAGTFGDSAAWGRCVAVAVDAQTSFFGPEGSPVEGVEEGDAVEAVGRFRLVPDAVPGAEFPVFDALVVEIGAYLKLTGTVRSAPVVTGTFGTFLFELDRGQGITGNLEVQTHLFQGTRFFSREGEELEIDALEVGSRASIDGVLFLSNTAIAADVLKAALVVVEITPEAPGDMEGVIADIEAPARRLTLGGGACALVPSGARLFRMTQAPGGTSVALVPLAFSDLAAGQTVRLFGVFDDSCLRTDVGFVLENLE